MNLGDFLSFGGSFRRQSASGNNEFIDVLRLHRDLWDRAFDGSAVICSPISASLNHEVTRDDLMTHILCPTSTEGEFLSLLNQKVRIEGQEFVTLDGFQEQKRVRVLSVGSVVNARGSTASVYRIGKPFSGGLAVPQEGDDIDIATARKFVVILKSFPETEEVFLAIDDFINEVNYLGKHSPDGYVRIKPSLAGCIASYWQRATYQLSKIRAVEECVGCEDHTLCKSYVGQIMESYIMGAVTLNIRPWNRSQFEAKQSAFLAHIKAMKNYTQSDFDVYPEFQCNQHSAIRELCQLEHALSPADMLIILKNCAQSIRHKIENYVASNYPTCQKDFTTDDLVMILAFVIVKSFEIYEHILV